MIYKREERDWGNHKKKGEERRKSQEKKKKKKKSSGIKMKSGDFAKTMCQVFHD
jgi:hypothetical protein